MVIQSGISLVNGWWRVKVWWGFLGGILRWVKVWVIFLDGVLERMDV